MQDNTDSLTETRNSSEVQVSFWERMKGLFCPCILSAHPPTYRIDKRDVLSVSKASETNHSNHYPTIHIRKELEFAENFRGRRSLAAHRKTSEELGEFEMSKRDALLSKKFSYVDKEFRETINIDVGFNSRLCSMEETDCSVCNLPEHALLPVGVGERQLLLKVGTASINVNLGLLKRQVSERQRRRRERGEQAKYGNFEFNRFWNQRYLLFERFDEGIQIDENSWAKLPPEQVCEYIAMKCAGAKLIVDAFAGVGATAIKFASLNSCAKVVANDRNPQKLKFLQNNAKIYEVDRRIELTEGDFLLLPRATADVVFLHPPLSKLLLGYRSLAAADFDPHLEKVIQKAMSMSGNLILLLPPEVSLDSLCSCLHRLACELPQHRDCVSLKVEKIYCQMQLKYILVTVGRLVQTDIRLSDELDYVYAQLRRPAERYFRHKRIIKKIREEHGMIKLLSLLQSSQRRSNQRQPLNAVLDKDYHTIDAFYELILEYHLVAPQKLAKIMEEQDAECEKRESMINSLVMESYSMSPEMEEEKVEEQEIAMREAEQTQSDYSHYTITSDKKDHSHPSSRLLRLNRISDQSIVIKRTDNDSKEDRGGSPNSPNLESPPTPKLISKNRVTQMLTLHNEEYKKKSTHDL